MKGWRVLGVVALIVTTTAGGVVTADGSAAGATTALPRAAAAAVPVPATEISSPAVTSLRDGRPDVFTRSAGGDLTHLYRPPGGSWTRSLNLGGDLASQPAAVSWAPGRVDVFARGTDDGLWHRWFTGGRWSGWERLSGRITSAPAVVSWAPGRLDVFAAGTDDVLRHRYYVAGEGWSLWERFAGLTMTSSPAATAWSTGRLDVFARGPSNAVHHLWFASGPGWSRWESLGGTASSQPAAASPGSGLLDLAVRAADGTMALRRFAPGTRWSAWTSLGTQRFSSGPAAADVGSQVRLMGRSVTGYTIEASRPSPSAAWSPWARIDPLLPFRRLGTWVDVFDYASLDPATAVPALRDRGVRVLYLSTARFTSTGDLHDAAEAGQWLDLAHQNGIQVVGWYLPAYGDMARDVRRTVAIARFVSPGGQRFDAVGVDIERLDEVTRAQFNLRLVDHLTQVRAQVDAVIGAIVPSPFTTDPGNNWEGFPWAAVGARCEVVVPMALWSFRSNADGSPYSPAQVHDWVLDQVQRARTLTGRQVSVEGGVDDPGTERTPITADRVDAFVDAAIDGGALGGSHYDYATTPAALWPTLARLNTL